MNEIDIDDYWIRKKSEYYTDLSNLHKLTIQERANLKIDDYKKTYNGKLLNLFFEIKSINDIKNKIILNEKFIENPFLDIENGYLNTLENIYFVRFNYCNTDFIAIKIFLPYKKDKFIIIRSIIEYLRFVLKGYEISNIAGDCVSKIIIKKYDNSNMD